MIISRGVLPTIDEDPLIEFHCAGVGVGEAASKSGCEYD
jgi:hypothetical protein